MAHTYPVNCDVAKAFSLLCDPDFLNARHVAIGEKPSSCEVTQEGDKTVLRITRRIKRDNVPKALTKILAAEQTIHFVEEWRPDGDNMVGHYKSEIDGLPIKVDADLALRATAEGCEYYIDHQPHAKIPLVGRLVEKFIISQSKNGVGAEIDYLNSRLD